VAGLVAAGFAVAVLRGLLALVVLVTMNASPLGTSSGPVPGMS